MCQYKNKSFSSLYLKNPIQIRIKPVPKGFDKVTSGPTIVALSSTMLPHKMGLMRWEIKWTDAVTCPVSRQPGFS